MLNVKTGTLVALGSALLAFGAPGANAATMQIDILDIGDTGTTADGTIFVADPNPTEPSTGTGVFEPFHRVQVTGRTDDTLQNGYNTEAGEPDINYDTKGGKWTDSILLGDLGVVEEGGVEYYVLSLDANEPGRYGSLANEIDITDIQIYLGTSFAEPELTDGYTGTPFDSGDNGLLGEAPAWTLDSGINGDVTVTLAAGICDSKGQCGSGHGDLTIFIPTDYLPGDPDDYFVLYTEYARAGHASGGFEEWRALTGARPIPEPSSALVFALGLGLVHGRLRRR